VDFQGENIYEWIFQTTGVVEPYNYVEKFIFHRKFKNFECEELKYKDAFPFHNLHRMFMSNIIKILSADNMKKFNVPTLVSLKIIAIVKGIKTESFKSYNNGRTKMYLFNH